ncbi:toll/interleukin-1 receptor domain-containing protein [Neptuniibacter sp. 2_MG-2023]|uniref:toll/interleukin-1 receptor domain-containing protein n=1 Tax=Neptuniibacter sp. 2_MG-2023 TaxID=3062671 RepID=UPI0026E3F289|nr:toll/interleukin-1 receptor domain-containing protein [Neptuniibacter sp. 2_MG-2023]MDO6513347.1 toll/interleukin-1 receptor domain-containing protein [Neptuniibacter sp. 2_MG-2023]
MNGDWGPVIVIKGDHKGKIGYYDDNDSLFSDEENIDPDFWDSDSWRDVEGVEEENLKALDVAIVYFGDFFIAKGYYLLPHDYIRAVTTDDLMKRREELHDLCGRFARIRDPDLDVEPEEEDSFLRELHYVDSTLVDRMIEARYSNVENGASIFISHSSEDKPFARWVATDLKASGHKPWLDEWEINVGESIPAKISLGVKEADFVIVILSENSINSNWVEREWQNKYWDEVSSGNIHVLPVLYRDCEIPELLKTKKYADFRNSYNDGLEDVLSAINHLVPSVE